MAKVQVLDSAGNKVKEISVPGGVLDAPLKEHLLYESVVNYRANQRSGSASTKTRAMVRGGGRKPWRQKGTGRARAGSTRSPIWRKGGITFGPSPRSYAYNMPKKVVQKVCVFMNFYPKSVRFSEFLPNLCSFFRVFLHIFLIYLAQVPQIDTPTPILSPKTTIPSKISKK